MKANYGIFISPKGVHENINSVGWSLIIWVVCGVFSALGAYCYAELGTFIRSSGGDYAYVLAAFGPLMGFLRMWIECIIVRPCTITAVAMTFATYILRPFYPDCELPFLAPQLLAAGCIILLAQVNTISVRAVTWVQNFFTIAKLLALTLIIVTGAVLLIQGGPYRESFHNAFEWPEVTAGQIALAFYSGLWAYNGWNYLNFITEELINPTRNLPLAIGISFLSYLNPDLGTPIPAVLFTAFLSLCYLLLSDNIYTLINYVQIVNWLAIGVATAGLIWLRKKQPVEKYPRPLKVNIIFPWLFLLGCALLVLFPMIQAPKDTAIGIGIMLTGLPVYLLCVHWQGKFKFIDNLMDQCTVFAQKLLLVVPEKKEI
uniref:Amino acid transporter n=1 Tax=Panagrolaimus sp. PS1159 TaxID=55785 RepID=A0AC35FNK9_9BILA